MRLPLLALVLLVPSLAAAQDADTLTVEHGWVNALAASVAASQVAYRDWQEGGVGALAATARVDGAFDRLAGRLRLHHDVRAALGAVQQDTLPVRKADDQLRYALSAEWRTGRLLSPSLAASAQSQFLPGYDVSPDSADYPSLAVVPGRALQVSAFGSPALFTQSVGVASQPARGVTARVGVGLKETVVGIARLRPVFGNAPGEAVRVQAGLDAEVRVDRALAPGATLRSRATAFQAFNQVGNVGPDLLGEVTLALRVGGVFQVTLDAAALYDADVLDRVQLRQTLGVGLAVDLL